MSTTRTKSKAPKLPQFPVFLSLTPEGPTQMGDEHYAHVSVQFCTVRDEPFGDDVRRPLWPENGPATTQADERMEAQGLERMGLGFACQIDSTAREGALSYAWRVGVIGGTTNHPIGAEAVLRMSKELNRMELAALDAETRLGRPQTFGQFVAYRLLAYEVGGLFEQRDRGDILGTRGWREHAASMLAFVIDTRVADLARRARKQTGKGEDLAA